MLPTLMKSWVISPNNVITGSSAVAFGRALTFFIKTQMTTLVTGSPWTVVGCCNGITSSMDGIDRWNSLSDIVSAQSGTAHSWMILKQSAIAPNFQVLIDCGTNSTDYHLFKISPSGLFVSGSLKGSPVATDSVTIAPYLDNQSPLFLINSITSVYPFKSDTVPLFVNVWGSSDGEIIRFSAFWGGTFRGHFSFEKPLNPVSQWTSASFGCANWESTYYTETRILTYDCNMIRSYINGAVAYHAICTEGLEDDNPQWFLSRSLLDTQDNVSGDHDWCFSPVGLFCVTSGLRGRQGDVFDLWLVSTNVRDGMTFPVDNSKQFIKMGCFVWPWDGLTDIRTMW